MILISLKEISNHQKNQIKMWLIGTYPFKLSISIAIMKTVTEGHTIHFVTPLSRLEDESYAHRLNLYVLWRVLSSIKDRVHETSNVICETT